MNDVTITVFDNVITLAFDDEAMDVIRAVAMKRGATIEGVVIEAMRLEQLFADRKLVMQTRSGSFQELVSV